MDVYVSPTSEALFFFGHLLTRLKDPIDLEMVGRVPPLLTVVVHHVLNVSLFVKRVTSDESRGDRFF